MLAPSRCLFTRIRSPRFVLCTRHLLLEQSGTGVSAHGQCTIETLTCYCCVRPLPRRRLYINVFNGKPPLHMKEISPSEFAVSSAKEHRS